MIIKSKDVWDFDLSPLYGYLSPTDDDGSGSGIIDFSGELTIDWE